MKWRINTNQIQGINLSYYKVELNNNIEELKSKLRELSNAKTETKTEKKTETDTSNSRIELECKLRDQSEQLVKVTKALKTKTERGSLYVETKDEKGNIKRVLVQELEQKIAAEEWAKEQEYSLLHPEYKKNNYFMKSVGAGTLHLQKEDSISDRFNRGESLTEQEQQQLEIYNEIREAQAQKALFDAECLKDSCFQRFNKLRVQDEDLHKNHFKGSIFETPELARQLIMQPRVRPVMKAHPDSVRGQVRNRDPNVVSFDDFFNS